MNNVAFKTPLFLNMAIVTQLYVEKAFMRPVVSLKKCGFSENAEFVENSPTDVGDAFMRPVCAYMRKIEHDMVSACVMKRDA